MEVEDKDYNGEAPISSLPSSNSKPSSSTNATGNNKQASGSNTTTNNNSSKAAQQITKLRDANTKYRNLLKMAKERIQKQEEEMDKLRLDHEQAKKEIAEQKQKLENMSTAAALGGGGGGTGGGGGGSDNFGPEGAGMMMDNGEINVIRVCQRINNKELIIKPNNNAEYDTDDGADSDDDQQKEKDEIWALFEYEIIQHDDINPFYKRYKQWKSFASDAELKDYIRRDTGEPLVLPPLSLTPDQSSKIQNESNQAVSSVTEEFRKYRIRSQMDKKQLETQIRDLHLKLAEKTTQQIEYSDKNKELHQAKIDHDQVEILRKELQEQEIKWKNAYDILMSENKALKSSGSEALLAAQWRHRYEELLKEKEDIEIRLQMETEKSDAIDEQRVQADIGKYEMKYRDLKESFKLYRKKAKEIFEAQQRGDVGLINLAVGDTNGGGASSGSESSKLSYLKNLMINYLSSEPAVRDHMEDAIGTVLNFTPDDYKSIEEKKLEHSSYLTFLNIT